MDTLKTAVQLLNAVCLDMEGITIAGVENQSRFVDCAHAIQTVFQILSKYVQDTPAEKENQVNQEVADGR